MSFMKVTDDIYIQYIYTKDAKFHKRTTKSIIRLRGFFCLCVGGFNCAFVISFWCLGKAVFVIVAIPGYLH